MIIKKIFLVTYCFTVIHTSDEPTRKKQKIEPFAETKQSIILYHTLKSASHLPSVKDHGLFSSAKALIHFPSIMTPIETATQQAERARTHNKPLLDARRDDDDIYFDLAKSPDSQIQYSAPTKDLWVFNALYRKTCKEAYEKSGHLLTSHLQEVEKLKKLKQRNPEKKFHLDPRTGKAEDYGKKRKLFVTDKVTDYKPEVVIRTGHIPSEDLIFLKNN